MIKEKKIYPSQINTKAIACRIPANDYVNFLQDAISKNITLNDWLLMKIYSNQSESKLSGESEDDYIDIDWSKETIVGNELLKSMENFISSVEEDFSIHMDTTTGLPYYHYKFITKYSIDLMGRESVKCQNIRDLIAALTTDVIALDKEKNKREINLTDIKAQLIILAEKTFESKKDVRDFMKDINEVLSELEY